MSEQAKPTFLPTQETPVLDSEQIELLNMAAADLGAAFWEDLMHTFYSEVMPRLSEIRTAAADRDVQTLRKLAHFIAGSSANIGMKRLAALCRNIESEIDSETFTQYEAVLAHVQREYEVASAEMAQLMKAA